MYKNRPIKLTLAALACEVQDVRWMQIHSFQVTWLKFKNLRLLQPARRILGSWRLKEKASKLTSNHIFNLRIVGMIGNSIYFHIVSTQICATIQPVIQKMPLARSLLVLPSRRKREHQKWKPKRLRSTKTKAMQARSKKEIPLHIHMQ